MFKSKKKTEPVTFFDLSATEKKKLINKAALAANKEQREMLAKYERSRGLRPAHAN